MNHTLDLDQLKGTEFLAWGFSLLGDVDFLLENSQTWPDLYKYNQNEFIQDYWPNLCTLYGFFRRLSTLIGRELTADERRAMCEERIKIRFDKNVWWYVVDGADTVRHWHNNLFPNDPIFSITIDNEDPIRLKFFQKAITITSSFRANAQYNKDIKDWFLDSLDYGRPTYGHCVGYHQLIKEDNYLNEYSFRKVDDYYELLKKSLEGKTSIALFKVSQLTETGKLILWAMKLWMTTWERLNELCTRFEFSRFVLKKYPVDEKLIWNKKNPNLPISLYESSIMLHNATDKRFPIYLGTDRNKQIIRRDSILLVMKDLV